MAETGIRSQIGIGGFPTKQITDETKNVEYRKGNAVSRMSNKSPRAPSSSYAGGIKALFYGFDIDRMLKGLLGELIFGNMGGMEYHHLSEAIIHAHRIE